PDPALAGEARLPEPATQAAGGQGSPSSSALSSSNGSRSFPKVGRNDPCPCGSGKKYKKCHGK
ncbi:SEC-C domain-containing protein, partial [Candidatus Azambacteria bacterium]|nr:SEC-C domain-containing protein [Candidatus Azambacteria bacterium]